MSSFGRSMVPALLVTSALAASLTGSPARAAPTPITLRVPVERATLDNGLRVVLDVDHGSPTVTVAVTYDVGSRDEERGRTGFAHLFEHMMFQGSANLPKGEHARLLGARGGTPNGGTGPDLTNYFDALPSSELALALFLEADRMKALDISQDDLENQRKVVQEEVRSGLSAPYGRAGRRLEALIFEGYWPYEHPTGGLMEDLDRAELGWVTAFHAQHYGPNNAVLSIAGDIDPAEAMALVHRYFDRVPKITVAPFREGTLPEQRAPRQETMVDAHARTAASLSGWAIPFTLDADHPALELAADLLGGGESSRLNHLLVVERRLAQSVSAYCDVIRRGPDSLIIDVKLAAGANALEVERLVDGELLRLARTPPSAAELSALHRKAISRLVFGLEDNTSRAVLTGAYELLYGDAGLLERQLPRYLAVTADDVRRVAGRYLTPARRSRILVLPAEKR